MELVSVYLGSSRSYQVSYVYRLWKENKILATPDMATYIEKQCGITRHHFDAKCREVMLSTKGEHDSDTVAEAILAYIIYCIDHQHFEAIEEALQ